MKTSSIVIAVTLLAFAGVAGAGDKGHQSRGHYAQEDQLFDYARVLDVRPRYREVEVSQPVRECRDQPVYHTERRHGSAGGMLAGGIIGGIVGHQVGKGRDRRVATAVGALIGAGIGHDAVNGHDSHADTRIVGYEEHCQTYYRSSYETVVDSYAVTYKYRGKTYHIDMPYDPGKRIKVRIQITPVI